VGTSAVIQKKRVVEDDNVNVTAFAFVPGNRPGNRRALIGLSNGRVQLCEIPTFLTIAQYSTGLRDVSDIVVSHDGDRALCSSRLSLVMCDLANPDREAVPFPLVGAVDSMAFTPDDKQIIIGNNRRVRVWRVDAIRTDQEALPGDLDGFIQQVGTSRDGLRIFASSRKSARVWDRRTKAVVREFSP
jgi:WD40 repeat protein